MFGSASMSEKCWLCGRDHGDLKRDLPAEFWDEGQSMFRELEVIGRVHKVDRVRPGDPNNSRHFKRKGGPQDEICSFDVNRWAVVFRKCQTIMVCKICLAVDVGLRQLPEETKDAVPPHHHIYNQRADELAIVKTWEKVRNEEKELAAEYPDDAYRILVAFKKLDHRVPITLWELSNHIGCFNHRSLETPIKHIMRQCPDLGEYSRSELKFHFTDPGTTSELLGELLTGYEEYYNRDAEVKKEAPKQEEVLARIKKVNLVPGYDLSISKW